MNQPLGRRTLALSTTRNRVTYADYYIHTHGSFATFVRSCVGSNRQTPYLRGIGNPDIGNRIKLQTYDARPSARGRITLDLSKTRRGATPLPLKLNIINMPGCWVNVSQDIILPLATNTSGVHILTLTVQNIPSTIGLHLYWQSTIFDRP